MKNSVGNVTEILGLLDKKAFTGQELKVNYEMLVEKWGEWEVSGMSSAGLVIRYVDVSNALFSGLMITFGTLTIISLCVAIVFGKIIFPLLMKHFETSNAEIVDLATLKSATQIDKIDQVVKKKEKEWF